MTSLDTFHDITASSTSKRLLAAEALLRGLIAQQGTHEQCQQKPSKSLKKGKIAESKEKSSREDDQQLCPNLSYALQRLVRGLASSNPFARQGFSLSLTQILEEFPVISNEVLLSAMDKYLVKPPPASKQEWRNFMIAKMFGALSLAQSGRLSSLSSAQLTPLVANIAQFAQEHKSLKEIGCQTLCRIIHACPQSSFHESVAPVVLPLVKDKPTDYSPEQLSIAVALYDYYKKNGVTAPYDHVGELLSRKEFNRLVPCLMETVRSHPRIHSVWEEIFSLLGLPPLESPSPDAELSTRENIREPRWLVFWRTVVDEHLLTSKNVHKQYLALRLLQRCLGVRDLGDAERSAVDCTFADADTNRAVRALDESADIAAPSSRGASGLGRHLNALSISSLLSKRCLAVIMQLLSSPLPPIPSKKNARKAASGDERKTQHAVSAFARAKQKRDEAIQMRKTAAQTLAGLRNVALSNTALGLVVVSHLTGEGGDMNFDQRTRTRTVQAILSQTASDEQQIDEYVASLMNTFLEPQIGNKVPITPSSEDNKHASHNLADGKGGKSRADAQANGAGDQEDNEQKMIDRAREWALDQLVAVAKNKQLALRVTPRLLQFCLYHGLFESPSTAMAMPTSSKTKRKSKAQSFEGIPFQDFSTQIPSPPLSERVVAAVTARMWTLLSDIFAARKATDRQASEPSNSASVVDRSKKGNKDAKKAERKEDDAAAAEVSVEQKSQLRSFLVGAPELATRYGRWLEQLGLSARAELSDGNRAVRELCFTLLAEIRHAEAAAVAEKKHGQSLSAKYKSLGGFVSHLLLLQLTEPAEVTDLLRDLHDCYRHKLAAEIGGRSEDAVPPALRPLSAADFEADLTVRRPKESAMEPCEEKKSNSADDDAKAGKGGHSSRKRKAEETKVETEEQDSSTAAPRESSFAELLLDVMLAALPRSSNLTREVISHTFAVFSEDMTPTALRDLGNAITAKDQIAKDDDEDEDEHEMDAEGSDVDVDGLLEAVGFGQDVGDREDEEEDGEDEDSEEEEKDEEDQERTAKTKNKSDESSSSKRKVQDAEEDVVLGPSTHVTPEMLEEMERYDEHLANIVKLRQGKKAANRELRKQAVHFKLRMLDLVEIFVKKQPRSPLLLTLFDPLLLVVRDGAGSPDQLPLVERAVALFRNKLCLTKEVPFAASDTPFLLRLVNKYFSKCSKAADSQTRALLSSAVLFFVRAYFSSCDTDPATVPLSKPQRQIVSVYSDALSSYLTTRRGHFNTKLFIDFFSRYPVLGWQLCPVIAKVGAENSAGTVFLRGEVFTLLHEVLRHKVGPAEKLIVESLQTAAPLLEASVRHLLSQSSPSKSLVKQIKQAFNVASAFAGRLADSRDVLATKELLDNLRNLTPEILGMVKGPVANFLVACGLPASTVNFPERMPRASAPKETCAPDEKAVPVAKGKTESNGDRVVVSSKSPSKEARGKQPAVVSVSSKESSKKKPKTNTMSVPDRTENKIGEAKAKPKPATATKPSQVAAGEFNKDTAKSAKAAKSAQVTAAAIGNDQAKGRKVQATGKEPKAEADHGASKQRARSKQTSQ